MYLIEVNNNYLIINNEDVNSVEDIKGFSKKEGLKVIKDLKEEMKKNNHKIKLKLVNWGGSIK